MFYKLKSKKILLKKLGLSFLNTKDINSQIKPFIKELFLNKKTNLEQDEYVEGLTRILLMDSKKNSFNFSKIKKAWKMIHRDLSFCLQKSEINFLQSTLKGTSSYKNASIHANAKYIMVADIKNFFGNTYFIRIKKFCEEKLMMSKDASALFSELVCFHHSDNTFSLGQGYPSSPILSFVSNIDLFQEIKNLLDNSNINYKFSVYVDDITISSNEYIEKEIIISIKKIFNKYKYKINKKKLIIKKIDTKPVVITGISIQVDKVLPYRSNGGMNYIRELNMIIEIISSYAKKNVRMNDKIRSTLLLKTKKGGDLFRKYHGIYTYIRSAQKEIFKIISKSREFRVWKKSAWRFKKINELILKTSKMWGKKPNKLSTRQKYKLKRVVKKIGSFKTKK